MSPGKNKVSLPESVKDNLPSHAQHIDREAHNNALKQYEEPGKRRGDASLEQTADKVAWAAVKQEYRKNSKGDWVKRED